MIPRRRSFAALTAAAYLLLSGVYLLYWNHVEYFTDDWFLLERYRQAAARGAAGVAAFAAAAVQNRVYGVFRSQWLSILYGFLVTFAGGWSAKFNFACLLLLHAACGWLLALALCRIGMGRSFAFLAGALYLLAPTAHFALFTYLTNPFFVFSTFWILAMIWLVARSEAPGAVLIPLCAMAAMFSGEQVFLLAWAILPLVLWCFGRATARTVAVTWGTLAATFGLFLVWLNRAPVTTTGLDWRYTFTWMQLGSNVRLLWTEWRAISGFTSDARFRMAPEGVDWVLAVAAVAIVGGLMWLWADAELGAERRARLWAFALAGVVLAYAPVLFISGEYSRLRYHYVPSPFLGITGAAVCYGLARMAHTRFLAMSLGGVLAGYLTLNAAADMRQGWIPQSRHQRALEAAIRGLKAVAPGDIVVISGTPYEIGAAQHLSMHSTVSAKPFVEWAAGVAPLEVGLEIVPHHSELELYHRDSRRHISTADLRRTHLLVFSRDGFFSGREWVAQPLPSGRFRLLALKGGPALTGAAEFSREQLALVEGRIYFPKPPGTY